jgi:hypothetical protein
LKVEPLSFSAILIITFIHLVILVLTHTITLVFLYIYILVHSIIITLTSIFSIVLDYRERDIEVEDESTNVRDLSLRRLAC